MRVPPVRPGCGDCANCRYLKYLRQDFVTCMISPGPGGSQRLIDNWNGIQEKHPCASERKPAVSVQPIEHKEAL